MSSAPVWTISRRLASGRSAKARMIEVQGASSWKAATRRSPERLARDGPARSTVNGPSRAMMSFMAPTRLQATTSAPESTWAAAFSTCSTRSVALSRTRIFVFMCAP
jgi:hypothetical protein